MMPEVIACDVNSVPSGAYWLDVSECLDYMLAGWDRPTREMAVAPRWIPPADFAETDAHYRLTMETPGIEMDSLDVNYKEGVLDVKGRKEKEVEEGECCYCSERFTGEFERRFQIPGPVDADNIVAKYENGILKITVPKSEESQARHIEVK